MCAAVLLGRRHAMLMFMQTGMPSTTWLVRVHAEKSMAKLLHTVIYRTERQAHHISCCASASAVTQESDPAGSLQVGVDSNHSKRTSHRSQGKSSQHDRGCYPRATEHGACLWWQIKRCICGRCSCAFSTLYMVRRCTVINRTVCVSASLT